MAWVNTFEKLSMPCTTLESLYDGFLLSDIFLELEPSFCREDLKKEASLSAVVSKCNLRTLAIALEKFYSAKFGIALDVMTNEPSTLKDFALQLLRLLLAASHARDETAFQNTLCSIEVHKGNLLDSLSTSEPSVMQLKEAKQRNLDMKASAADGETSNMSSDVGAEGRVTPDGSPEQSRSHSPSDISNISSPGSRGSPNFSPDSSRDGSPINVFEGAEGVGLKSVLPSKNQTQLDGELTKQLKKIHQGKPRLDTFADLALFVESAAAQSRVQDLSKLFKPFCLAGIGGLMTHFFNPEFFPFCARVFCAIVGTREWQSKENWYKYLDKALVGSQCMYVLDAQGNSYAMDPEVLKRYVNARAEGKVMLKEVNDADKKQDFEKCTFVELPLAYLAHPNTKVDDIHITLKMLRLLVEPSDEVDSITNKLRMKLKNAKCLVNLLDFCALPLFSVHDLSFGQGNPEDVVEWSDGRAAKGTRESGWPNLVLLSDILDFTEVGKQLGRSIRKLYQGYMQSPEKLQQLFAVWGCHLRLIPESRFSELQKVCAGLEKVCSCTTRCLGSGIWASETLLSPLGCVWVIIW